MTPSQTIMTGLVVLIIIRTVVNYRRNYMSLSFSLAWLMLWVLILYLLYNQPLLSQIALLLKIGRGVDVAVYFSIVMLFYLVYLLLLKINKLEKKITMIVRELALQEGLKEAKSSMSTKRKER